MILDLRWRQGRANQQGAARGRKRERQVHLGNGAFAADPGVHAIGHDADDFHVRIR